MVQCVKISASYSKQAGGSISPGLLLRAANCSCNWLVSPVSHSSSGLNWEPQMLVES